MNMKLTKKKNTVRVLPFVCFFFDLSSLHVTKNARINQDFF